MEKKVKEKRVPNCKEEIPDYTIDLTKIEYKKKLKLTEDNKITKLLLQEGKGTEAKIGATIYYIIEARYKDGTLCNPKADRKGTNKIVLKGGDQSTRAFEIALSGTKFGEIFWCKFSGKLLTSLKYYRELPPSLSEEGKSEELWCKFAILKIKHAYPRIFCDFPSLMVCIDESKRLAKEYIELAKIDEDLYGYALEIYKFLINTFKQLPKQVKQGMTHENFKEKEQVLLSLHLNVAFVQICQEQFLEAKAAAEAALDIDATNVKAAYRLAQACMPHEHLQERAYQALKICFDKEPDNPSLGKYAEWYKRYKENKEGKRKKCDPWKHYKKLLEEDEILEKQGRKKQRLGGVAEIEEDKTEPGTDTYIAYNSEIDEEEQEKIPENAEHDESPSIWDDVIKEEQEAKKNMKKEDKVVAQH